MVGVVPAAPTADAVDVDAAVSVNTAITVVTITASLCRVFIVVDLLWSCAQDPQVSLTPEQSRAGGQSAMIRVDKKIHYRVP
jgi:hypothetical protein